MAKITGQKRVLISDPIERVAVDILEAAGIHVTQKQKASETELIEIIKDYDGLVVRSGTTVTANVIEAAASNFKVIGRAGTVCALRVDAPRVRSRQACRHRRLTRHTRALATTRRPRPYLRPPPCRASTTSTATRPPARVSWCVLRATARHARSPRACSP
jgi:hypothetical protein